MTRYLVLGDPVVALGRQILIPDGALIIQLSKRDSEVNLLNVRQRNVHCL